MRTTLTLDDDVATRVQQLCAADGLTWKEAVNLVLRMGLSQVHAQSPARPPYTTPPVHTGAPRVDLTRIGELQALDDEADWGRR